MCGAVPVGAGVDVAGVALLWWSGSMCVMCVLRGAVVPYGLGVYVCACVGGEGGSAVVIVMVRWLARCSGCLLAWCAWSSACAWGWRRRSGIMWVAGFGVRVW
ncbi:hypothetical protein KI387_009610, partial [Taxus chinensis]